MKIGTRVSADKVKQGEHESGAQMQNVHEANQENLKVDAMTKARIRVAAA